MNPRHLKAFKSQRSGARARRIPWELTADEWLTWWGDDIERRGQGANCLQMQRNNDSGPYALWNITKGTPKQNSATANEQKAKRHTEWLAAGGDGEEDDDGPLEMLSDPPDDPPDPEQESLQSMIVGRSGRALSINESLVSNFMRKQ